MLLGPQERQEIVRRNQARRVEKRRAEKHEPAAKDGTKGQGLRSIAPRPIHTQHAVGLPLQQQATPTLVSSHPFVSSHRACDISANDPRLSPFRRILPKDSNKRPTAPGPSFQALRPLDDFGSAFSSLPTEPSFSQSAFNGYLGTSNYPPLEPPRLSALSYGFQEQVRGVPELNYDPPPQSSSSRADLRPYPRTEENLDQWPSYLEPLQSPYHPQNRYFGF
jgi:hypothetical protein